MATVAQAASHSLSAPPCWWEQGPDNTSPCWLLDPLVKEITINAFQEPPGLLMPCFVVLPVVIGLFMSTMRDRACEQLGCFYLSVGDLNHLVFLAWWPVADPHCDVMCPFSPFSPDPQTLCWLLIHPQRKHHGLQLSDSWGWHPVLVSLLFLPKKPLSFHFNATVIGAIPSCLHNANKSMALQVCACL